MANPVYWWEEPLKVCPICKRKFAPAPSHYWKINYDRLVCSYSCMRAWERVQEANRRRRYKKGG